MLSKKINFKSKLKKTIGKYDAIYESFWLSKFINNFSSHGKKLRIENMVYSSFYKNQILFKVSIIFLFFEIIELMKSALDLVLAKKNIDANKIIYPKPLQFLNQYKKKLKIIASTINHRQEFGFNLKLKIELLSVISKKSSLYLKKENIEKLSVKNRSLKYYRWHI